MAERQTCAVRGAVGCGISTFNSEHLLHELQTLFVLESSVKTDNSSLFCNHNAARLFYFQWVSRLVLHRLDLSACLFKSCEYFCAHAS